MCDIIPTLKLPMSSNGGKKAKKQKKSKIQSLNTKSNQIKSTKKSL